MSSSLMAALGGIIPLYIWPLTSMGPWSPWIWILMRLAAGPFTHSDPASGGNVLGMPSPVGPWHAMHLAW